MLRSLPLYIAMPVLAGIVYGAATYSADRGFKDRLLDYIEANATAEEAQIIAIDEMDRWLPSERYNSFKYRKGDWERLITTPAYQFIDPFSDKTQIYSGDEVSLQTYGALNLDLNYGDSIYTKKRYQQSSDDLPESKVIKKGFKPEQELQLHMEGKIGERLTIYVDHDSRKQDNHYRFQYRALTDNEVLRELNAGEIDIKFNDSKYAVYDDASSKGMGVDLTLKKGNFKLRAFGSVIRGNTEVEVFRGNSLPGTAKLAEYQYIKRTYYQLEPFIRYNNTLNPPYPANYTLSPVYINPYSLELYLDDQTPHSSNKTVQLPVDGGYYRKLLAGSDYQVNYATGLITLTAEASPQSRIFAVYTLSSGSSTDPYALQPGDPRHPGGIWAGKTFVFIKYGYSITETPAYDQNKDGKVNQDVYEVRSFYRIGNQKIMPDNFLLQFFKQNGIITRSDIQTLGRYTVDYTAGTIQFDYREPFKELCIANNTATQVYSENQPANVSDYSRFQMRVDYFREARSFQLKHTNILPNSLIIKVDGRKLEESLYTIDYINGFLAFTTPTNPLIGSNTMIEVRYEYLPPNTQSQSVVAGVRGDYQFNRNLRIGGSFLFNRTSGDEKIPEIGKEPTQTLVYEGDTSVFIDGKTISDAIKAVTGKKTGEIPVEFKGYAEYAVSSKNTNTFGKALIDNMETSEDIVSLSLNERDWILSSPPAGVTTRSVLNYYLYRDLAVPQILKGLLYPAAKIDYAIKPGPYNVASGHIVSPILSQDLQTSLVLDFDGAGDYASIVTRRLSNTGAVDLSGVQYVEISYRCESTASVQLRVNVGRVNEDVDGSGLLKTEDLNGNGVIDSDPATGLSEDRGWDFNQTGHPATRIGAGPGLTVQTRGNGVLDTNDLNGNGMLDTVDQVFDFHGQAITTAAGDPSWKVERIYIDPTLLTASDTANLKVVESVRLYVQKASGNAGRIYIDNIKFVSTKWRDTRLDGSITGPTRLKATMVNSIDDFEYGLESFKYAYGDTYKTIYGIEDFTELAKTKETALKLEYSIPTSGSVVTTTRRFTTPMDIRHYKTLNVWMNYRSFSPGDQVGIRVGSSDTDYIEYRVPMDIRHFWRELKLRLTTSSAGEIIPSSMSGLPDLKRITMVTVMVIAGTPGSAGTVWANEFYVSEPMMLRDSAHWYEGEIKITKPLYTTKGGTPILSDISVKFIQKGHGQDFTTIGQKNQEIGEEYHQVFSSIRILPNWLTTFDYQRERSRADDDNEDIVESKRGNNTASSYNAVTEYISNINGMPSFKINYKYNDVNNRRIDRLTGMAVLRRAYQAEHYAVINIQEQIDKFLGGKMVADVYLNLFFKSRRIKREAPGVGIDTLANVISPHEMEKRQRGDCRISLEYISKYFYLKPMINFASEELVNSTGRQLYSNSDLIYDFSGSYHAPFVYNRNCRFTERNKIFNLSSGFTNTRFVGLGYKIEIQYLENRFRDTPIYDNTVYEFRRNHDARAVVGTTIDIPFHLSKIKSMSFVKHFAIVYARTLYLTEYNVPFEGERKDAFDEKYGIKRAIGSIADAGLNIYRYYPFYFFAGRKNAANARDYVYNRINAPIWYSTGQLATNYNNQLRLLESMSVNWSMDFKKLTAQMSTGVNQNCERLNLSGVPSQIITANVSVNTDVDLMKVFSFGFFRPNKKELPYHGAFFTAGYKFEISNIMTANVQEYTHSPELGLNFKRDRMVIGAKFGFNFRKKHKQVFISYNPFNRSARDTVFAENIQQIQYLREKDTGYNVSTVFETDIRWLHKLFSYLYRLYAYPVFSLEYTMNLNRYNYLITVAPQPYDLHLLSAKLMLDLHKNLRGGLTSKLAIEEYRNKINDRKQKEVLSYELGMNFSLLF